MLAERAGLPPVKQIAAQPGTKSVYRITLHYPDQSASDVIGTVRIARIEPTQLQVVYYGHFNNKPLIYPISEIRLNQFIQHISKLKFDKLPDQPDIPYYGVDLCMIERAAGTFLRSVLLAPKYAQGVYATLFDEICRVFPELIRKII
ncbi:MAG: hypothetical protein Kow00117_03770 [Phototrophicales bacterium]